MGSDLKGPLEVSDHTFVVIFCIRFRIYNFVIHLAIGFLKLYISQKNELKYKQMTFIVKPFFVSGFINYLLIQQTYYLTTLLSQFLVQHMGMWTKIIVHFHKIIIKWKVKRTIRRQTPSDGRCDKIINRGTEQDQLLFLDCCANFSDMMKTGKGCGVNEEAIQVAN